MKGLHCVYHKNPTVFALRVHKLKWNASVILRWSSLFLLSFSRHFDLCTIISKEIHFFFLNQFALKCLTKCRLNFLIQCELCLTGGVDAESSSCSSVGVSVSWSQWAKRGKMCYTLLYCTMLLGNSSSIIYRVYMWHMSVSYVELTS